MRRLGSFLPGEVVGGSAVHWSGHTWRWTDMEFKVRSNYEERYGKKFIPEDMTIQDWGISYAELEPYYDKFERTAAVSGKAGNLVGKDPGGRQPVRGAARPRLSIAAADPDPGERDVYRRRAQCRLSSLPTAIGKRLRALHQSGRFEIRRLPILRLLPALWLRSQRQGQPAHDRDPDRDGAAEFRTSNEFLGHQGAQGLRRQARHRRRLHQRTQRRGIRAAGFDRVAVRLRHQQRAPHAVVRHRRALRPRRREAASSARTTVTRPAPARRCSSKENTSTPS